MPGRLLGLYALATMEEEQELYGYALAERIAQRTDGAWRPGPGAIYPALASLAGRGLARARRDGLRQVYRITPKGRAFLRRVRSSLSWGRRGGPDLGLLWSEIAGRDDPGEFLVERLERQLETLTSYLARPEVPTPARSALRDRVRASLERADRRLREGGGPGSTGRRGRSA